MIKRMRGRKLQARNLRFSQNHPLCATCRAQGRIRPGTQTDHIVALVNGGTDTEDNLQRLCDACHASKTARDLGHKIKPLIGLDGWPVEEK